MDGTPVQVGPSPQALSGGHVEHVVALLAEASAWAGARGALTWGAAELDAAIFLRTVARGELFGLVVNDDVVGCMLLQDADRIHWPYSAPGEAMYLHKLAVRRQLAGRGLGERLVDVACHAATERGVPALRLDTTPMTRLQDYYGRLGFVADPAGPADYAGRWLVRMEKRL